MDKSKRVEIVRWADGFGEEVWDHAAVEEPLQITVDGFPIAVVMRTPGNDADLVRGFLITEGVISSMGDVSRIDLEQKVNHALVFLTEDAVVDLSSMKRNLYSASSCGICGKASIEHVFLNAPKLGRRLQWEKDAVLAAPSMLRASQETFDTTGGIHAAGLFSEAGELLLLREDVGRHNAIDKVIGAALEQEVDLQQTFLQLSGRVSFEVVQKALMAQIPMVSAISAPTSLAVKFANDCGMILLGFVRGGRMNIYSGGDAG